MLSAELSLGLLLLIPLLASVIIGLIGKFPNLREGVTFLASFALLANVINLVMIVSAGGRPELVLGTFAGNFELKLVLEPLGAVFAAIASSLWIVNSLFTMGYMRGNNEKNQTRFFLFVAIAIAGMRRPERGGRYMVLF